MADITQRIVVKVDYEGNLKSGIDEVKQLGKVAEDDVKAFQSLQKEINAGINDALEQAGVSMKDFAEASKKATDPSQFKSLKQQIKEAKDEATGLAAKFGDTSKQAIDAQKKVAKLTDELGDFNDRVKALNPDAKFNAVNQTLQGTIGAFQGITGAAQLFGAENKALNETLMKMQGLLNLTQGVNSVMQLKDAFTNLRVVLGMTAAAEGAVSVGAAAIAVELAPVVIIGAAVLAVTYKLTEAWGQEAEALKASNEAAKEKVALQDEIAKSYIAMTGLNSKQVELMKAQGKSELEILQFKLKQNASDQEYLRIAIDKANDSKIAAEAQNKLNDAIYDGQILQLEYNKLLKELQRMGNVTPMIKIGNIDAAKQDVQEMVDKINDLNHAIVAPKVKDEYDKHHSDFIKKEDEKLAKRREVYEFAAQASGQLLDIAREQQNAQMQYEEEALQGQLKRKEISQKQYDAKLRALKRKQAEDDKKYAIFQALIDISRAILVANTVPPPGNISAIAFASALGALQLGQIIARPVPKFAKGSLFVNGGNGGVDDIPAYLNRGEAVIPTHTNRAYAPAIDAIYHNKIHPSVLNAFVHAHKSGKTSNTMVANMELMRAVKGNGTVNVRNAHDLAEMIGTSVANKLNHRRR